MRSFTFGYGDRMGVVEDDGPGFAACGGCGGLAGAGEFQFAQDLCFGAVLADGEGYVQVLFVDGGADQDAVLQLLGGDVVGAQDGARFDFAVLVEGGGQEVLFDVLSVRALVKVLGLLDQHLGALLTGWHFDGAKAEDVGLVAALEADQEGGGDGTFDVEGVLGVGRIGADAVLHQAVLVVDDDGLLDVGNLAEVLETV